MKLNNLQIIRGISALLVCCFHFKEYINFEGFALGNLLFQKGSIGVPIFFVISGFIMTFTTKKLNFASGWDLKTQIVSFYKKRVIRIVPLYYLLTIAWMVPGGSFFLYFSGAEGSRLFHSLFFLPEKDTFPVLYLGWSLNFEMFFYLIFGLSLFFRQRRYYFIVLFFLLTFALGLIFPPQNAYLAMVCSHLNLYFISGISIAHLLEKVKFSRTAALFIIISGVALFGIYFFGIVAIENIYLVLVIITLLVLAFLLMDFVFQWKGNKFLVFLGDISYSLYLSHPFVEIFFRRFKIDGYLNIPYLILKLIIAIGVAAFLYYFVEKKITHYLKTKLRA